MEHKYKEVLQAWLDGKTIQYISEDTIDWADFDCGSGVPYVDSPVIHWRIKPENIKRKFRVGLFNHPFEGGYYTGTIGSDSQVKAMEGFEDFVKWLTDWIEYEIEVKE